MRSQPLLSSFTKYCKEHPHERFWQALRNWSGWGWVLVCKNLPHQILNKEMMIHDTFNWEGTNKPTI